MNKSKKGGSQKGEKKLGIPSEIRIDFGDYFQFGIKNMERRELWCVPGGTTGVLI